MMFLRTESSVITTTGSIPLMVDSLRGYHLRSNQYFDFDMKIRILCSFDFAFGYSTVLSFWFIILFIFGFSNILASSFLSKLAYGAVELLVLLYEELYEKKAPPDIMKYPDQFKVSFIWDSLDLSFIMIFQLYKNGGFEKGSETSNMIQ